mgnify:CR=1 FL=1
MSHKDTNFLDLSIKHLPAAPIVLRTIQSEVIVSKTVISHAAIDNGPVVTKDGVRRGNNGIAMRSIGRISRHNPQRQNMISHSKILLDKASAKKEKSLAIPEQVHAMIRKSHELEASIAKKLAKGNDASNLVKCLSVLQARVRYLLDHCEEKGLLEIKPMKPTVKAKGSFGKPEKGCFRYRVRIIPLDQA